MSPAAWELAYEDKLAALHKHASQLSLANGIDEISKYTIDAMENALGFDVADITVIKNNCLTMVGRSGKTQLFNDIPLSGRGITARVANTKASIRVTDTRKEPSYVDGKGPDWNGPPSMLSELAVPVIVDGETVAVLNVESKQLNAFSISDQELLETLAFHVRSAFKRLRYEAELRKYSEGLQKLVDEKTRELRESEIELRTTKERLEYIISSNPAVIYSARPLPDLSDWELTFVGDRVFSLLGYAPERFVGHPEFWRQHVHPQDLQVNREIVQKLWKNGHVTFDYQFQHKDRSYRWIREEATATRDTNGNPIEVNGYWTDVTALKQTEQALIESEKRLAESKRLAAIGATTAMVGHDLRNPLQGIAAAIHLLKNRYKHESIDRQENVMNEVELLDMIDESVSYMDKIVSDLQNYAATIHPETVNLSTAEVLKETLSTITIPLSSNISINVNEDAKTISADPILVKRIFTNLITNALQAMPHGGELKITARREGEDELISFYDTGEGIPDETLPRLFEPFFTTKAKGQGLGLAVCKRLVEAQGGAITVDSRNRGGCTFTVKLPAPTMERD